MYQNVFNQSIDYNQACKLSGNEEKHNFVAFLRNLLSSVAMSTVSTGFYVYTTTGLRIRFTLITQT